MKIVGAKPGYSSHVIGTRNLDMALAGDFDGDGQPEVVLPNQGRTKLGGIQRVGTGAAVSWEVPLEGILATNLAAVTLPEGDLILGAGLEGALLRIWAP